MATLYNQYQYKLSWAAVKHPLSSATPDQRTTTPSSRGINLPSLLPPSFLPPSSLRLMTTTSGLIIRGEEEEEEEEEENKRNKYLSD